MTEIDPSVYLANMTWPEAEEAFASAQVAIIPVGAHEQHGPGMLLSTDIVMATTMAGRVATRMKPRAVVAPSLPFGLSSHHMRFPGTITLSPETFESVLMDVMESLIAHGLTRFFILNSHGGNRAALSVITTKARSRFGVQVANGHNLSAAADLLRERFGRTSAHACEIEASYAMAAAPHLLRSESMAAGEMLPARYRHTLVAGGGALGGAASVPFVDYGQRMDEITENGNIGDPRLASIEAGEEVVALIEQRMIEFLEDFTSS
ncbi:MAG: creatininase family protein [Thermomicrobiales bacterium]|nr:creatininase family protein [Thermomicrobiales bacterium]